MKKLFGCLLVLVFSSCSSISEHVDKPAVEIIKRVAIVGYTFDYQKSLSGKNILQHVLTGSEKNTGFGKMVNKIGENEVSKVAYNEISKKLSDMTGWQVIPYSRVIRSSTISRLYEKKNKTLKTGVPPLNPGKDRFERARIPQQYYIQQADINEKRKMATELNADALITLNIKSFTSRFSLFGIPMGTKKYNTEILIDVINPDRDEVILRLGHLGEKVTNDEKKFMDFESGDDHEVGTYKGLYSATDQLLNHIKEKI